MKRRLPSESAASIESRPRFGEACIPIRRVSLICRKDHRAGRGHFSLQTVTLCCRAASRRRGPSRNNKPVTPITETIAVRGYAIQAVASSQLGGNHVVAPQELHGRSQAPRIHCDDRPDQMQRLRLRAALGALPEGYRGRAAPHHLRLRAALSGKRVIMFRWWG